MLERGIDKPAFGAMVRHQVRLTGHDLGKLAL